MFITHHDMRTCQPLSSGQNTFLCVSTFPPTLEPLEPPSTTGNCPQPSELPSMFVTLKMCPFHHQSHPSSYSSYPTVSGQPSPSAWPSKMHHPHVAPQLFRNHSLKCPTPHHLQPLLLSPRHLAGYLATIVFTSVEAHHCLHNLYRLTLPAKRRSVKSLPTHPLCAAMWVQAWESSMHQQNMELEYKKFSN